MTTAPLFRSLPAGDAAWLIELPGLPQALALFEAVQAARQSARHGPAPHADALWAIHTLVPAARTVLVEFAPHEASAQQVLAAVHYAARMSAQMHAGAAQDMQGGAGGQARRVEIPVHYEGEDLEALAAHLRISRAELIERHTGCDYHAAFAGFAPGFVYLSGGDPCFTQVPRLATPRTRVPAGSVALAGDFSAVYPKDSPGGWQLIGATPLQMWDLQRDEPALVQPGFRVRFVDLAQTPRHISLPAATVQASASKPAPVPASVPQADAACPAGAAASLHVLSPGLQTLVQDRGRRGVTGMGVSASGALDGAAMRAANRCVGNPIDAPVLENTLGLLRLRCQGRAVAAVTGACTALRITTASGAQLRPALYEAFALEDGDVLELAAPTAGLRCYLAVRGGLGVPPVLGSAATDTLAGIGPAPLAAGDVLPVGQAIAAAALRPVTADAVAAECATRLPRPGQEVTLDICPGPRDDWFAPQALALLEQQRWHVTLQSNRVGIRLQGQTPLPRAPAYADAELPSEGTVTGALQVPASGQPVLFLADHPLTGGYPVIAVLARHHLDLAAQVPPGAWLRFRVLPRREGDLVLPPAKS
ncbi:5-oxoprolinase/urea amidolyase family protein [Allofranklinella schreckenbergeri]|uniref:5-oxoprolinase/urea amidolyase family protein n=1 Tax=Allofranklinella schreckenbergeri TaxID=1076744 RepID=A0A3M6R746_9BURK|nr:5-oxoprolinase/urea amidolyase family protein [Allofranklinella schreckenbergeri]RMX10700.1 5-oxoprolinase/urea amidolyase family protein [Allofranklinella schreckenbergeri]